MRTVWIWFALGAAIALAALLQVARGPASLGAAPDFSLESLKGEITTLSEWKGNVVIIDFWASWCAPCKATFPDLQRVVERLTEPGVVLWVVDLDRDTAPAVAYMEEHGFPLDRVLHGSLDAARAVKALYGVGGIPHTVVVGRDGEMLFSGYPTRLTEEKLAGWL